MARINDDYFPLHCILLRNVSYTLFNVVLNETAVATALRRERHFVPLPQPEFTSALTLTLTYPTSFPIKRRDVVPSIPTSCPQLGSF
jgi:hypothetical protein